MERPIMNPVYLDEAHPSPRRQWPWRRALRWCVAPLRFAWRAMVFDILHPRRAAHFRVEDGTPVQRIIRALVYRLLFLPVVLVLIAAALVYTGTHPVPTPFVADPTSQGIYYDPVTFLSEDNVRLEGWLVPVLDARKILAEKEKALGEKHPAVVLVHDYASTRQQMLPLVAPLHEAGFVVLVVTLRGHGFSGAAATTFGLNEALDVKAAVELLRRTPFVNPAAIGAIGLGTGGTAVLLAAERDVNLAAAIADHPGRSGDEVIADRIAPHQPYLQWINPLCKWSFNVAYGVDSSDINLDHFSKSLQNRAVLVFDGEHSIVLQPSRSRQITDYLKRHLQKKTDTVARID